MFFALLLALPVLGQAPATESGAAARPLNAPVQPDRTPTAWACTVDTLLAGKDCLFEASAEPVSDRAAQQAENVRFAQKLAQTACARAARPVTGQQADKALGGLCEKEFTAAAESCGLEGQAVLVDGQGRFAPAAIGCYRALSDVLQRASMMGSVASACCRCMAARGCGKVNALACYQNVSRGAATPAEKACMADTCADECGDAPQAPRGGPVEASMPPPARKVSRRFPANAL
jgi:hypothetical protein